MIYFITNLFKISFFAFLVNDLLKNAYPETYNEILMNTTINVIYVYSLAQIKFKNIYDSLCKTNPRLKSYFDEYNNSKNKHKNNLDFILDGKIIQSTQFQINSNMKLEKYDFAIYSDYTTTNKETNCINKLLLSNLEISCDNIDYEVSDIRFLLCELIVNNDTSYKIDLKNDNYNYYLVNNIIDKKFIIYYLLNHYYKPMSFEDINKNDKFILKIIDHNVNTCEIDITDNSNYIQIKKDNYIKI
jgi:hypothetical protein